ncbi:MAG: hypothetical protein Dasosvirus3_24 [Dasosvirus sp.]|uniref:Uncharacterized protein n=1 Tax=Dasosvirus sp. TaxID=2487764 RepID=A0A3G4ZRH2_9VIRU|nr:MAG: hypothetical protein Dasosvirus3_24 [Dasosvirus sp.]
MFRHLITTKLIPSSLSLILLTSKTDLINPSNDVYPTPIQIMLAEHKFGSTNYLLQKNFTLEQPNIFKCQYYIGEYDTKYLQCSGTIENKTDPTIPAITLELGSHGIHVEKCNMTWKRLTSFLDSLRSHLDYLEEATDRTEEFLNRMKNVVLHLPKNNIVYQRDNRYIVTSSLEENKTILQIKITDTNKYIKICHYIDNNQREVVNIIENKLSNNETDALLKRLERMSIHNRYNIW